jgi:DNA-binding Lrp family transcriptional regulator
MSTRYAIADAVHVAASTSLERIRSLRERGVIRGYHAEADLAALGREVQALIAIRIRPPSREKIEAFRDWAYGLPETVGVFVVSGGDDFLLHVAVRRYRRAVRLRDRQAHRASRGRRRAHLCRLSTPPQPRHRATRMDERRENNACDWS